MNKKLVKNLNSFGEFNSPFYAMKLTPKHDHYHNVLTVQDLSSNKSHSLTFETKEDKKYLFIDLGGLFKKSTYELNDEENKDLVLEKFLSLFDLMIKDLHDQNFNVESKLPFQGEEKGLEWIKTSIIPLKSALESFLPEHTKFDPKNRLTLSIWSGKKETDLNELRVIIFNLDFKFIFNEELLEIVIYNKKNAQEFDYQGNPDFHGKFQRYSHNVIKEIFTFISPLRSAYIAQFLN